MGSSIQIEDQAAAWLMRRDGGDWSADDEAAFNRWLASTAHRVAYIRLQGAWRRAQRLQVLGAGAQTRVPGAGPFSGSMPWRRMTSMSTARRAGALAAALGGVLLIAAGWYLWPEGAAYRTPLGGLAVVPMADGSKMVLNTDSQVRVTLSDRERRIQLKQGEAYFEVENDPHRPFLVQAAGRRVVVVGTKFSVRRQGRDLQVVVAEGKVRIDERREGAFEPVAQLPAGSVARIGDMGTRVEERALADADALLSWRNGYLVFKEVPLGEAVAEFNRYNERKITIRDPEVAMIRVSGNFRPTNVEAFIRLIEEGFPVRSRQQNNQLLLTRR